MVQYQQRMSPLIILDEAVQHQAVVHRDPSLDIREVRHGRVRGRTHSVRDDDRDTMPHRAVAIDATVIHQSRPTPTPTTTTVWARRTVRPTGMVRRGIRIVDTPLRRNNHPSVTFSMMVESLQ